MGRPSTFTQETSIYALLCPDTRAVRYIGKANDPARRLKTHIRDARRRRTPVYLWLRRLHAEGKAPILEIIERPGCVSKGTPALITSLAVDPQL